MVEEPVPKRTFTLVEARMALPEVMRLTQEAFDEVCRIISAARHGLDVNDELDPELQDEADRVITKWSDAVGGIGGDVKGLWLVDFDCGHGYYCWKYPEEEIAHYHSYEDGFQGRMRIL